MDHDANARDPLESSCRGQTTRRPDHILYWLVPLVVCKIRIATKRTHRARDARRRGWWSIIWLDKCDLDFTFWSVFRRCWIYTQSFLRLLSKCCTQPTWNDAKLNPFPCRSSYTTRKNSLAHCKTNDLERRVVFRLHILYKSIDIIL